MANTRDVNLRSILKYEIGPIPLSLFKEDGSLRKNTKSQMMRVLEERYGQTDNMLEMGNKKAIIIDAMSMVQVMKGSGTFYSYAKEVLLAILKLGVDFPRIDVVFDVYNPESIKSAERTRRGSTKLCTYTIAHNEMPIPKRLVCFPQ